MGFSSLYNQTCDFQSQVIGAELNSGFTLQAPKVFPSALNTSIMPVFINTFSNFPRRFVAQGQEEYNGEMVWTLYTSIAGTQERAVSQYDTMNILETAIGKAKAYPFLEISGVGESSLIDPIEVVSVAPLLDTLRYAGNQGQLFVGGRVIFSIRIDISKVC